MGSAGAAGANPSAMPPSSPAIARAEAERRLALRSSSTPFILARVSKHRCLMLVVWHCSDRPPARRTVGELL